MTSHKDHAIRIDGVWIEKVRTRKGDIRCAKCGGRFRPTRARAKKKNDYTV